MSTFLDWYNSPKSSINYSQNTEKNIAKTPTYNMPICRKISDQYAEKLDKISVAITDVPEEEWKEKVWEKHIAPDHAPALV